MIRLMFAAVALVVAAAFHLVFIMPADPPAIGSSYTPGTPSAPAAPGSSYTPPTPSAPPALSGDRTAGLRTLIITGDATLSVGGTPIPLAGRYGETGTLANGKPTFTSSGAWPEPIDGAGTLAVSWDIGQGWKIVVHDNEFTSSIVDHDDVGAPPDLATPDLVEEWTPIGVQTGTFEVALESAAVSPPCVIGTGYTPGSPSAPAAPGTGYTPGSPSAPAAPGTGYTPGSPSAPAAPGSSYTPPTPSAPPAIGSDYSPS